MKEIKLEKDKDLEKIQDVFFGEKKSEHSNIENVIIIGLDFISVILIAIFIDRFIHDNKCIDKIIDVVAIYLCMFVLAGMINCHIEMINRHIGISNTSVLKVKKYIIKFFYPILAFFVFLKKCDFIFIKEFFIEIGIIFILCIIGSYEIAINGIFAIKKFMGGQGSIYYVYLFVFGFILIFWSILKKILHFYIFKIRKRTYGGENGLKEMYFKHMCYQLKEIFYFFSIILMLNDYIETDLQNLSDNNSGISVLHVFNVCLIILFALDTLRINWKAKMEMEN